MLLRHYCGTRGSDIAMNISRYMKDHEASLKTQLLSGDSATGGDTLRARHSRMIAFMQHERLVHLLVMLATGTFLLATVIVSVIHPAIQLFVLGCLFLLLFIPYLVHYFFLENTIQRWYRLMDDLEKKYRPS